MQISGKRALVVGGASGLARASAEMLVQAGASVAILDLPTSAGEQVANSLGSRVHFVGCDIADHEGTELAVRKAVALLGGLDIGVNVAGGGTLSITGDVAHSGGTTIAALTTLQIGNGGATGALSGAGTISNSGTLAFNRTGSTTVQGVINGAGNLSVGNGATVGTLILTGNNGYAGTTTINANATLQVGNGTARVAMPDIRATVANCTAETR